MNRLAGQSSVYLLQHAHNPVDWFPWGPEAFEKARRENKPLLISIGYSTCHWCHVMERECFENPGIAAVMNENLVSVKVDREERPDVDRLYMTAVQAITGQGGWPLNVFVTPEGKPIIGGTYFPPEPRQGRRAWPDVVAAIGASWRDPEARARMVAQGDGLTQAVREFLTPPPILAEQKGSSPRACLQALDSVFDEGHGGFSSAPKFPMPTNLYFLARFGYFHRETPDGLRAENMVVTTLRNMARGGIFDSVGGGFHRYSTDERWFLPHFEKMLYDNAQLAVAFTEAYQRTGDPVFAGVAQKTLDYLLRDMAHPDGGFYSAEDADSLPALDSPEKAEGAFYIWTMGEIRSILGDDAELFALRYGVRGVGNVEADPFGEFSGKNVLFESVPIEEAARQCGLGADECAKRLEQCLIKLQVARGRRTRPIRDDKILTSWNGLALSAFALGARVFSQPRYLEAAQKTASFVKDNLWDGSTLWRRWRLGQKDVSAMADDHSFLAQGLVDLYEADYSTQWLVWAEKLVDLALQRFQNVQTGALYSAPADHDPLLLLRAQEEGDNVEPSAASVLAGTLIRLSRLLGRDDFQSAADRMIQAHSAVGNDRSFPVLQSARLLAESPARVLVIVGPMDDPRTNQLISVARRAFYPDLSIIVVDGDRSFWSQRQPLLAQKGLVEGNPTAYLCHDFTCQNPATGPKALARQLGI
ncbi:MAG: thioredoxin domain-containing protein [Elusimicrobia bacterium]|nr:thioredoxin domain-containing protein [Elusimicrobiota bacterium]